jgi:hypothetical protein
VPPLGPSQHGLGPRQIARAAERPTQQVEADRAERLEGRRVGELLQRRAAGLGVGVVEGLARILHTKYEKYSCAVA